MDAGRFYIGTLEEPADQVLCPTGEQNIENNPFVFLPLLSFFISLK